MADHGVMPWLTQPRRRGWSSVRVRGDLKSVNSCALGVQQGFWHGPRSPFLYGRY